MHSFDIFKYELAIKEENHGERSEPKIFYRKKKLWYFFYANTGIGKIYHRRDIAKAREKYPDGTAHSVIQPKNYNDLCITPLPILLDNYSYLITDKKNACSVVVDPGDPEPVLKYLKENDIVPEAALITHKHWDHSGGNAEMKKAFSNIRIYGGVHDNVNNVTHTVDEDNELTFGNMRFTVKFTPGHTVGHVVYLLDGAPFGAPDHLFSGDHLFLSGCGRMFEESAAKMLQSLDKLSQFKADTLVWPGHEYALDNLDFSCHLDPDNVSAQDKLAWSKEQREKSLCTCPTTLEEELSFNPFLRTKEESVLRAVGMVTDSNFQTPSNDVRARALAEIRARKDSYKYKL
ncbi:hypothetical protein FSP39_011695 [Pinctada imbricata]|uniref:Metallo-beta-lactamase domain-containing protein n=1 Tax=Pinctada imbricata TaxID=66713 RepID=A0AA88YV95_PINIB|nr:hypothetical protein FSP39_011695 [Pinctada imbricata]